MRKMMQCQSCGMPLKKEIQGTERDGSLSDKYCLHCYENGAWTSNLEFNEMYAYNLKRFKESDMNKIEKIFLTKMYTKRFMQKLERWQDDLK